MIQIDMDCEGPITQNDNAFELCEAFLPKGGDFFARVSKYDDFLADIEKRPGYKAGDTLKLVLPFLLASGVDIQVMRDFSLKTLVVLPGAEDMLSFLVSRFSSFIISTSYRPYLDALSMRTGFASKNIYCTELGDDIPLPNSEERSLLQRLAREIVEQPILKWPDGLISARELSNEEQKLVKRLDQIFWEILPQMPTAAVCYAINTVGGREKAVALQDSLKRTGNAISQVLYAGDSITDVQALELVRNSGGVAISFNGNAYAVRSCDYMCTGHTPVIIAAIAQIVAEKGVSGLNELLRRGPLVGSKLLEVLGENGVEAQLISWMEPYTPSLALYRVTPENMEYALGRSEYVRKEVRGGQIAELG
ncbi:MAG: hypothetical protein ABWK15_08195 [Dissulfuribacterales bacterium]